MISFFKILQFVRNDRKRSQRLINHLIREKRVFLITINFFGPQCKLIKHQNLNNSWRKYQIYNTWSSVTKIKNVFLKTF